MLTEEEARARGFASNVDEYCLVIVICNPMSVFKTTSIPSEKHYNKAYWNDIAAKIAYLKYTGPLGDALSLCEDCRLTVATAFVCKGTLVRTESCKMVYDVELIK